MTTRAPIGASNRADLFTSSKNDNTSNHTAQESEVDRLDDSNPLQLEHMLGYAGDYKNTLIAFPHDENYYVKGLVILYSNFF
jgi:predicted phage-related endonuclease